MIRVWAKAEAVIQYAMNDKDYRLKVCVHEAAHAIYMERAGFVPVLHGPVIFYYSDTDIFESGEARASGVAKEGGVDTDTLAMARWYVAGGVAISVLNGDGGKSIEPGDGQDFEVLSREFVRLGRDPDEIAEYWE
jgi:hypothetical protein